MTQPQRLDVALTITWESRWHVGSGQGTATIDRLLHRRASGGRAKRMPFVPGSQIKGVLRHQCERLAAVLGGDVVSPHVVGRTPHDSLLDNFRLLRRSDLMIDRLFGSRFQGECLFVEDALAVEAEMPATSLHGRTAIDRVSGTARDRALFVTEVAPADGPVLKSSLHARHPPGVLTQDDAGFPLEYALLLAALLSLDSLGGDKSTGLGRCRVALGDTVRWNADEQFPVDDAMESLKNESEWFDLVKLIREEGQS